MFSIPVREQSAVKRRRQNVPSNATTTKWLDQCLLEERNHVLVLKLMVVGTVRQVAQEQGSSSFVVTYLYDSSHV